MKKKVRSPKVVYQKPEVKSEQEIKDLPMNCPTTNARHCGYAFSPKKG